MLHKPSFTFEKDTSYAPKCLIYYLTGKLEGTSECYGFLEDGRNEIHNAIPCLLVHLGKISFLSSSGIGILAALFSSACKQGSRISLVAAPDRVESLLKVVNLWNHFIHYPTIDEALSQIVQL